VGRACCTVSPRRSLKIAGFIARGGKLPLLRSIFRIRTGRPVLKIKRAHRVEGRMGYCHSEKTDLV